jgi:signal transduction histidine kinase
MDWNYPEKSSQTLAVDSKGTLWVGTNTHIYYLLSGEKQFRQAGDKGGFGSAVSPDGRAWMYVPQKKSLVPLSVGISPGAGSYNISIPSDAFTFAHDGTLWTATQNDGLRSIPLESWHSAQVDQHSTGVQMLTEKEGLLDSFINAVLEDREGNIWIGSESGLERFRHRNLTWSAMPAKSYFFALVAGENGDVWTEARNSSLQPVMRVQDHKPLPGVAAGGSLTDYRDPEGTLWFSGYKVAPDTLEGPRMKPSLWRWSGKKPIEVRGPDGLGDYRVTSITSDRTSLWVSIAGKGEFQLVDGAWRFRDVLEGAPDMTAYAAWTDAADRIWLSYTERKEVAVLDHGAVHTYTKDNGLTVGAVHVLAGHGNIVCAGGDDGVAVWNGSGFHNLIRSDRTSFGPILSILFPDHDGVWLGTTAGILHISEQDFDRFLEDPNFKVDVEIFDLISDLPEPLQVVFQNRNGAIDSHGVLWVASEKGIVRLDPTQIRKNPLPPPVSIWSFIADNKSYSPSSPTDLPPLTREIRFDYTALSLTIPERVRFRYKLEGWDSDWQNVGSRRQAFFTNLRPGKYSFRVIACNNDGVWNDEGATLNFEVKPAWYQTIWFRFVCVGAFGLLLWALYQLRLQQLGRQFNIRLEERVGERMRIARELHDTLLQSFHGLLLRFQTVYDLLPTRPAEAKQSLGSAIDQAAEAITEGRDAVQGLRSSTVETNDLAVAIRAIGEELSADGTNQNGAVFQVEVEGMPRNLQPILRDEVYRIAGEALRNAFLHSQARKIEVEIRYDDRQLRLRVRDDGKGIDPKVVSGDGRAGHYGLHGMRERAKLVGGKLAVWSELDSGTEVELTIPASIAYATSPAGLRSWLSEKFSGKETKTKS